MRFIKATMPGLRVLLGTALALAVLPTFAASADSMVIHGNTPGLSSPYSTPDNNTYPLNNGMGSASLAAQAQLVISTNRMSNSVLENVTVTNTLQLWNGSAAPQGSMTYIITENIGWLSVSPSSGFTSNNVVSIAVISSAGTNPTGAYSGTITVDAFDSLTGSRASGAPQNITVAMTVKSRTPVNFEAPEARGVMHVGQTLYAWRGLWQNDSRLLFAYQWQMANDKYGSGLKDITNAAGTLITTTNCTVTPDVRSKYVRVKVTAIDYFPTPLSTTVYSTFSDAKRINATPDDFCGDGLTDLWLFEASSGTWRVAYGSNYEATVTFGNANSAAVPADYDGDGKADPAIYVESSGLWTVMLSASQYATASMRFGGSGYEAVPADFDGDGKADPATYNESAGLWSVLLSANSYQPAYEDLGGSGYQAVTGDFDGDGKADPAVYQSSTGLWMVMLSGSGYAIAGLNFGGPEFTPAPGDFDGDSKTDVSVYWAAGNRWWMRSSQSGSVNQVSFGTSNGSGSPTPGYFDYDAKCDPATVQLSGDFMIWCIQRSDTNLGYRGQSFQFSIDRWRVSW